MAPALDKAVSQARDAADYSGVVRIEIDDTARKRNQSYISIMANFDHQRAVAVTQGRGKGALGRLCGKLKEHAGEQGEGPESHARHGFKAYSLRVADMPQAAQSAEKHKAACPDEIHMALKEGGARFTQLHIGQKLVIPVTNK